MSTEATIALVNKAAADIERAKARTGAAVESLRNFRNCLNDPHDFDAATAELRGAIDDLYDHGIDLTLSLKGCYADTADAAIVEPAPVGRFAIEVKADTSLDEIETLRAAIQPGDIIWHSGANIVGVTPAGGAQVATAEEFGDKPETPYAVRVYYADDTMEEIHDVAGIQVANLADGTFPVGFLTTEDSPTPVAGTFDAEGEFVPLEVKPERPGW